MTTTEQTKVTPAAGIDIAGATATIKETIAGFEPRLLELSHTINAHPELSFQEHESAKLLAAELEANGFETTVGVYGLDTAIEATYGTGDFVVAVCAEYDALPEIGHGCGHNIIATAGLGAALALKEVADSAGLTVKLLGTPAEEHGGGKAIMLEAGAWEDATISLMVHGAPEFDLRCDAFSCQAVDRFRVTYTGRSAHAAAAPDKAVNAQDAALVALNAIGLLREHLVDTIRTAGVITEGGHVTNIVPGRVVVEAEVRAFDLDVLEDAKRRVMNCYEGGALATGCMMDVVPTEPRYDPLVQEPLLAKPWNEALEALGRTFITHPGGAGGSTDMGNVSQVVPSIHPSIGVKGATGIPHTAAFAADAVTEGGDRAVIDAATGLAIAAATVALDPDARAELLARQAARPAGSTQKPAWV